MLEDGQLVIPCGCQLHAVPVDTTHAILRLTRRSHNFDAASTIVSRTSAPPSSMMRTMLNRVAAAAFCALMSPTAAFAQVGSAELLVRIDRLENQVRQFTGQLEQMQYRNQQLEAALKRLQEDNEFRFQELGSRGGSRVAPVRPGAVQPIQPAVPSGRRADAFDPAENPNAPGAPRVLGSIPPQAAPAIPPQGVISDEPTTHGGTATAAGLDPGSGRVPMSAPPRSPGSTGPYAVATAPPSSPREVIDLGT